MGRTKGKLKRKLLQITLGPMILAGIAIMIITYFSFADIIHTEVQSGLQNVAVVTQRMMDHIYRGDYTLQKQGEAYNFYKGKTKLTGNDKILQEMKQDTDIDVTFFYGDTRVLTTLEDENGESFIGTVADERVVKDVFKGKQDTFYQRVLVGEEPYFAYYMPLYNGDGSCVGMVFAGKPTKVVNHDIIYSLIPIFAVLVFIVTISCFICSAFTNEVVVLISNIKTFLREIAQGNLKAELDSCIILRDDELGEMGRFTVHVQKFLREMVEKDMLTKLYSRRIGDIKLKQIQAEAIETGTSFCVALGDIDFFKKFNDTYGHACGDKVLKEVAAVIANNMVDKGFAVRWGGEEFLIVYENTSLKKAKACLEQLRENILDYELHYNEETLRITMTFGIVEGSKEKDISESIKRADDLLYQGKLNGRNQIVTVLNEV